MYIKCTVLLLQLKRGDIQIREEDRIQDLDLEVETDRVVTPLNIRIDLTTEVHVIATTTTIGIESSLFVVIIIARSSYC